MPTSCVPKVATTLCRDLAHIHLDKAVRQLREAGIQEFIARGLLARAALHTHTRAFPLARKDPGFLITLNLAPPG